MHFSDSSGDAKSRQENTKLYSIIKLHVLTISPMMFDGLSYQINFLVSCINNYHLIAWFKSNAHEFKSNGHWMQIWLINTHLAVFFQAIFLNCNSNIMWFLRKQIEIISIVVYDTFFKCIRTQWKIPLRFTNLVRLVNFVSCSTLTVLQKNMCICRRVLYKLYSNLC